jgi:hypothetical protein
MEEDGRGDVVRNVPGEHELAAAGDLGELGLEHIAFDDVDVWPVGVARAKERREVAVDLDGHHAAGARRQQVGERAAAGSDLDHRLRAAQVERVDDALQHLLVARKC